MSSLISFRTRYTMSCLAALLLCLFYTGQVDCQTGIVRIPDPSGRFCPNVLKYTCTTTGRGTTELNISPDTVFSYRQSQFAQGGQNDAALDGELTAGNLSRSGIMECYDRRRNMSDYCFTARLAVEVTNRTVCQNITCTTAFTGEETIEFGKETIQWRPPPISSLRMASQSITSVTVVWELGTTVTDCPGIMYEVTTLNCGSCPSRVSTVNTNVTCEDLPADTVCDVSVRSVLECGAYSDLVMISVLPLEVTPTSDPVVDNTGKYVGIGAAVVIGIVIIIIVPTIIVIIFLVRRRRVKSKQTVSTSTDPQNTTVVSDDHIHDNSMRQLLQSADHEESKAINVPLEESVAGRVDMTGTLQPSESETAEGTSTAQALILPNGPPRAKSAKIDVPSEPNEPTSESTNRGMPTADVMALPFQPFVVTAGPLEKISTNSEEPSVEDVAKGNKPLSTESGNDGKARDNQDYTISDGGKLLTQELSHSESEEVKSKKPVVVSGSQDGSDSSRPVAINGTGTRKSTDVTECVAPVPDIRMKVDDHEQRLARLETNQCKQEAKIDEQSTKISELQKEISRLSQELKDVKSEREKLKSRCASLEKDKEDERRNHEEETAMLNAKIVKLEEKLALAEKQLDEERKMPRKALSTDTSRLDARPEFLRTKSCPGPP